MSAWLGSLITALVASLAVIATNLLNRRDARILREDEREQRRLELDRATNEAAAADQREYRRKMDDQWRDARLEAHVALLAVTNEAMEILEPIFIECLEQDSRASHPAIDEPRIFSAEFTKNLESAVARVEVIGSQASSAAARLLTKALTELDGVLYVADAVSITVGQVRAKESRIQAYRANYLEQIRGDLGTAD